MFKDRLEIDSPGQLPNGMTIEGMEAGQATRNEVIASVFGRIPVGAAAGPDHRRFLMERPGDGVSIIRTETQEATGKPPQYEVIDESSLVLRIPAAKLELVPADRRSRSTPQESLWPASKFSRCSRTRRGCAQSPTISAKRLWTCTRRICQ